MCVGFAVFIGFTVGTTILCTVYSVDYGYGFETIGG